MSMSSSLVPETEIESMDAGPSKRAKTEAAAGLKKQLVVCFLLGDPTRYDIQFYSIQELLCVSPQSGSSVCSVYEYARTPTIDPKRLLFWHPPGQKYKHRGCLADDVSLDGDDDDQGGGGLETNPYSSMSFLHSSKPGNDLLYAVGGFKATGRVMSFEGSPIDMHNEFLCIPLSSSEEEDGGGGYDGQKAKVLRETSMKKGKLFPLIVEIGHCIYVLSMAPYPVEEFPVEFPVESAFEVYNLEEEASGWKSLPAPPFIGARGYRAPCNRVHRYSYLVVDDQKLFVSDGISSCVFDTWTRVWEKCDLFSECFPNIKQPWIKRHWSHIAPPDCCGPGFPFKNQPILWKDNIFLCFIPADAQNPPIAAFHIISDYSRAVQMPLRFDCLFNWYWPVDHLVHLGGDYIAVVAREDEYQDCLTILTFKLSKVDGGIVSCQLKSERHCRGFISNYCFAL